MLIMNAARLAQAGRQAVWLALAGRRTATRAYKSASLKDRKLFALIVLDAPSPD